MREAPEIEGLIGFMKCFRTYNEFINLWTVSLGNNYNNNNNNNNNNK